MFVFESELRTSLLFPQAQRTASQLYVDAGWSCTRDAAARKIFIVGHQHYRLVLKAAGVRLRKFKNAKELFGAGVNVLEGEHPF